MEVQGSLGRQIQGISQQPASVRLPGQCTDAVNMSMDVVDGTKSRPGTTHIARLRDGIDKRDKVHHYDRGDGIEEYFFVNSISTTPQVFDKQGRMCGVTVQDGAAAYMASATDPQVDVQFLTIGDTTFMLNRKQIVRMRSDRSTKVGGTALVFSAFGQYGTTYKIHINGVQAAEFKTNDGGTASDVETIRTERIAQELYDQLLLWGSIGDYNVSRNGTVISISRVDGNTNFTVSTEDGAKGKDLVAIKGRVSSTDLLPSRAPVDYLVQVWPTGSNPESRYWLKAEAADGNLVTWKESTGSDIPLGFDKNTMPYIIERTSIDGSGIAQFTIKHGPWDDRKVGDELTNPVPSFVDQSLSGMFMVQNRLGLLAGESCILSRSSYFFDFFRFTVLSALDTDPIDIFADAAEVYALKFAKVLDGDTVLFSEKAQFILPGDKPLTKATAMLKPTTTFEIDPTVEPVVTGEAVMFATMDGAYSNIREFYTDSYSDTKKAQATTSHVNKLLEGRLAGLAASSNFNKLFALSDKDQSLLYIYDWLWQGTDKVQSAWHRWKFPDGCELRGVFYSGEKVYILINRMDSGLYLERMDIGDPLEFNFDQIRMDRQVTLNFTWDEPNLEWVSPDLPWVPDDINLLECVIRAGHAEYNGGSFTFRFEGGKIRTRFDLGSTTLPVPVVVGQVYPVEFEPSDILIKDNQDRVSTQDVPTIGLIYLNLDKYPDFEVKVTNRLSGSVRTVKASNRRGGASNNVVGYVRPAPGTVDFPLRAKSTDVAYRIVVKSPHTFQLRDIEWEGSYNPTKRRV